MKKRLLTLFCFTIAEIVFALPGFKPTLPDSSGTYVYYEDKTFKRKSFAGFLCYDEKTYAARYVAPQKNKLPKIAVTLFFTIDDKKDFIEITGERIESEKTSDDGEIINYLHDMVYELHSRRVKAKDISRENIRSDNMMQFGGNVVIEYNELVPLFNIRKIAKADDGDVVFDLVTIGKLSSNEDASFKNFEGLPENYVNEKKVSAISTNEKRETILLADGARISLDAQWKAQLENMWTLGNDAMLTISKLSGLTKANEKRLLQSFLQSGNGAFIDWQTLENEPKLISLLSVVSYATNNKKATRILRKVFRTKTGEYVLCTLAVFESSYKTNKNYFQKIMSSFAVK